MKRKIIMNDNDKFEGFIDNLIDKNEIQYGTEARMMYGDDAINASNKKMKKTDRKLFDIQEEKTKILNGKLIKAFSMNNPSSDLAQEVCKLHEKWIKFYWTSYSKESHMELVKTYVSDKRFKKYYDNLAVGSGEFLLLAMKIYLNI